MAYKLVQLFLSPGSTGLGTQIIQNQQRGIPHLLKKTLQSTNLIESVNAVVRQRTRNVKNWQSGDQVERWAAAGLLEAEKKFRRIRGYQTLPMLIDALTTIRLKQQQAA